MELKLERSRFLMNKSLFYERGDPNRFLKAEFFNIKYDEYKKPILAAPTFTDDYSITYDYDDNGKLISSTDTDDGSIIYYKYDKNGIFVSNYYISTEKDDYVDRSGIVIEEFFDDHGNIKKRAYDGISIFEAEYDDNNKIKTSWSADWGKVHYIWYDDGIYTRYILSEEDFNYYFNDSSVLNIDVKSDIIHFLYKDKTERDYHPIYTYEYNIPTKLFLLYEKYENKEIWYKIDSRSKGIYTYYYGSYIIKEKTDDMTITYERNSYGFKDKKKIECSNGNFSIYNIRDYSNILLESYDARGEHRKYDEHTHKLRWIKIDIFGQFSLSENRIKNGKFHFNNISYKFVYDKKSGMINSVVFENKKTNLYCKFNAIILNEEGFYKIIDENGNKIGTIDPKGMVTDMDFGDYSFKIEYSNRWILKSIQEIRNNKVSKKIIKRKKDCYVTIEE